MANTAPTMPAAMGTARLIDRFQAQVAIEPESQQCFRGDADIFSSSYDLCAGACSSANRGADGPRPCRLRQSRPAKRPTRRRRPPFAQCACWPPAHRGLLLPDRSSKLDSAFPPPSQNRCRAPTPRNRSWFDPQPCELPVRLGNLAESPIRKKHQICPG